MQVVLSLRRNAKQALIVERVQKILMEKVNAGLDTIVHLIPQNLCLLNLDSSLKDLVMKSKNHVVPVLIRMNMAPLTVNTVPRVANVQINRWDGTIYARLGHTVSFYHKPNALSVLQGLIQMRLVLTISTSAKIVFQSIIAQILVLIQCKKLFNAKRGNIVCCVQLLKSCSHQVVPPVTTQISDQVVKKTSTCVIQVSIAHLVPLRPNTSRTTAFKSSTAQEVPPLRSIWPLVNL